MSRFSLDTPPLPGSGTQAVKMWWDDFEREATPQQKKDLAARGIHPPEFARPQHATVSEYQSGNYRQFVAEEEETQRPIREAQRLADIRAAFESSEIAQAAKQRKLDRENAARDAESAECFRAYHHAVANPPKPWSRAQDAGGAMLHYAISRGVVKSNHCCWSDRAQFQAIRAELHDPARMAAWGKK